MRRFPTVQLVKDRVPLLEPVAGSTPAEAVSNLKVYMYVRGLVRLASKPLLSKGLLWLHVIRHRIMGPGRAFFCEAETDPPSTNSRETIADNKKLHGVVLYYAI